MASKKAELNGSAKYKNLVSISQAAAILGISIDTVRRWDKAGVVKSTRPDGKNRYFSVNELEKVKLNKPLTISEAAHMLKVSASTLRRLEKKGLIEPYRNGHNERLYDRKTLEKFLSSEYFIRQKEVEEEVLQPLKTETRRQSDNSPDKSSEEEPKQSGVGLALKELVSEHQINIHKLRKRLFFGLGILGGVVAPIAIFILILTAAFLINPKSTAKSFHLLSPNQANLQESTKVKAASIQAGLSTSENSTIRYNGHTSWKDNLRPLVNMSLSLVNAIDKKKYAVATQNLKFPDINTLFQTDNQGKVQPVYTLFLDSNKVVFGDQGQISNLNSSLVRGKKPGLSPGDLAVLPVSGGQGGEITDGSITSYDIADGAITAQKLAPGLELNSNTIITQSAASISEIVAGNGLSGGGASGSISLNIEAGNGINLNNDSVNVDLSSSGATSTTSSNSGLEVSANGLRLIGGCSDGQILKWNGISDIWYCAVDNASGSSLVVKESDSSVSVSSVGDIQFGPATTSSDEFVVTDQGGGTARVTLGSQVAKLNANQVFSGINTFSNASNSFAGDGSGLTSLNASNITSGTLSDNRLSANVALLNGSGPQTFTGDNKFTGTVLAQNTTNSSTAFQIQNSAGNAIFTVDTSGTQLVLGKSSSITGQILFKGASGTNSIILVGVANPGGNRTLTLPDETGTLCSTGSVCSGYAAASGSGNYIQNQSALDQTADFRISGTGRAATALQAPLFDTASATVLAIGTTNATAINLNQNTTIAAGKNLSLTSGGGTFSQTYSSGTNNNSAQSLSFTNSNSGAGNVAINGLDLSLVGTATSGGINSNSALKFEDPSAAANNVYYGLNFVGTGYTDILRVNGTQIINGSGKLNSNQITGTIFSSAGDSGSSTISQGQTLTIAGGNGLTSTDNGSRTLTLAVGAGAGISVGADTVAIDQTSSLTWTGTEAFNGQTNFTPSSTNNVNFTGDNDSNVQISNNLTSDVSQNALAITLTDNASASTGNVYGLSLTNVDNGTNTGVPDALAYLNNANAAETVPDGLLVEQTGAGTLTNGIEIKRTAGTLTNGLTFSGTFTKLINSTNFNVTNAGALTAVGVDSGSGLLQGTGGLTLTGAASINGSGSGATTIGNSSGGAVNITAGAASTFKFKSASATALQIQDTAGSPATYLTLDTRAGSAGASAWTLSGSNNVGIASTSNSTYTTLTVNPSTVVLTNSTEVTSRQDGIFFNNYSINDASAVTVDEASTLAINGAPKAGGGGPASITTSSGLRIPAVVLTNVTNGYGLKVDAPSGATSNYAGAFAATYSSDQTANAVDITLTDNASASTGTLYGLSVTNIDNSTNTGVPDAIAYLKNANAAETVPDALLVEQTGAGTLTNGVEVKQTAGTVSTGLQFTGTFSNVLKVGSTVVINGSGQVPTSVLSGSIPFSSISSGTNTSSLTVGNGGSLSASGTGTITSTDVVCTDCIALTTETTGNYVASVTNGTGITGGNGGSEGAGLTLGIDQTASLTWTGTETFTPSGTNNVVVNGDNDSNIQVNSTISSDVTQNGLALSLTDNASASTGTVYGLSITNADNGTNTGVPDAIAYLVNKNAAETVPDGLLVEQNGSSGTLTSGIEVKQTAGTLSTGLQFTGTIGTILKVGSTTVINGSGQLPSTQLTGTLFSSAGDSGSSTISQGQTLTIVGGNGLTSTDNGSRSVTLAVGAGTGISLGADTVAIDQSASLTWTGNTTFTPSGTNNLTFNGDNDSGVQVNSTISSDVSQNGLALVLTDNASASTGTLYGLSVTNADNSTNTGVPDAIAYLKNANTAETVPDGLLIEQNGTGGTLTNALEIKQSGSGTIANGLVFTGTFGTNLISASNFTVSNGGTVTATTVQSSSALTLTGGATSTWSVGGTNQNLTIQTSGTGTLALDTTGAGTVNVAPTNATTVVLGGNTSTTITNKVANSSASAYSLQTAGGTSLITVDTTNSKLTLKTASATPLILVLSDKNTSGDPTGVSGAMYYNSNSGNFRCDEAGVWYNCLGLDSNRFRDRPFYSTDFLLATNTIAINDPWLPNQVSSGTTAQATPTTSHPGVVRVSSSATTNSGMSYRTSTSAMKIGGGESFELVFNLDTLTNLTMRFGFVDTTSVSDCTNGAYIEIPSTGALVGKTAKAGSRSTTGTSLTVSTATWYRAKIVVNSGATEVDFFVYDDNGNQLWTDNLTTNIPANATGSGAIATESAGATAALVDMDYMAMWWDKVLTR